MSFADRLSALLGLSTYQKAPPEGSLGLDKGATKRIRDTFNGQLSPLPITRTRWYQKDVEDAIRLADLGDLLIVGQLYMSIRRDGMLSGLLSTRSCGLVSLPKKFAGDAEITKQLAAKNGTRSVFDDMLPPAELALLDADGFMCGVGVGELLPVAGRDFPVLVRLNPMWLQFRWTENRWYYNSIAGPIPITPGDGRWVLHVPGGRVAPWQNSIWQACARAWINKEHAFQYRTNWESKLANPARVAIAPQGASEPQKQAWFRKVMAWGVNTVFGLTPGYDVKLLESNGIGYQSFQATIDSSNLEFMVALAGQTVTTDGGTGFANADVHKSIRADLIKSDADALAYTVNTQCLPAFIASRFGEDALDTGTTVEWDVTPPKDLKSAAETMNQMGQAITAITNALAGYERKIDIVQLTNRFGIPIEDGAVVEDAEPSAPAPQEKVLQ